MALADTAALVSSLELKDKFTPTVNKFEKSLAGLERSSSTFGKIGGHVGQGISSAVTNLTKLAAVGAVAIGSQVKFGLDSLKRLEDVTIQTNAVLRSTKGVAGETADAIRDLANKYEDLNATIDDKVIQSGENLLLTFTSIRKDAFEPALQAALDLNQALGGGEAGLQGVIIQVGKALQDPVRGLTALRRVGVAFSDDQAKQIKDLVKHNKLYEAQQLILAELTKEFGGSFAAAGQTATGKFAKLADAVDDAQQALATALLPALVDVATELNKFLRDPAVISGIKDFGKGLAGAFRAAVGYAKQVPWKAIGDGLRTAAGFAGTLIEKFAAAPDWLKTAVITGWGLNKLTGGAVSNIFGDLIKGIGGNFLSRGSSAGNPIYTKEVGVGGAGGPTGGGIKGLLAGLLATAAIGIAIDKYAELQAQQGFIANQTTDIANRNQETLKDATAQDLATRLAALTDAYNQVQQTTGGLGPAQGLIFGGQLTALQEQIAAVQREIANRGDTRSEAIHTAGPSADTHSEDRRVQLQSIDAIRANTVALATNARTIEKAWLKTIDPKDIAARSKAASGKTATTEQVAAIRSRDILHQLEVITTKSKQSNEQKLARLQELVKAGDPKTAAKVKTAIAEMKARIATEQAKTTGAVTTGTTTLEQAIAASKTQLTVNVTTEVTANGVTKVVTHSNVYGPADSTNKGTTGGKIK